METYCNGGREVMISCFFGDEKWGECRQSCRTESSGQSLSSSLQHCVLSPEKLSVQGDFVILTNSQLVQVFENKCIRIGFPHFSPSVKTFVISVTSFARDLKVICGSLMLMRIF